MGGWGAGHLSLRTAGRGEGAAAAAAGGRVVAGGGPERVCERGRRRGVLLGFVRGGLSPAVRGAPRSFHSELQHLWVSQRRTAQMRQAGEGGERERERERQYDRQKSTCQHQAGQGREREAHRQYRQQLTSSTADTSRQGETKFSTEQRVDGCAALNWCRCMSACLCQGGAVRDVRRADGGTVVGGPEAGAGSRALLRGSQLLHLFGAEELVGGPVAAAGGGRGEVVDRSRE